MTATLHSFKIGKYKFCYGKSARYAIGFSISRYGVDCDLIKFWFSVDFQQGCDMGLSSTNVALNQAVTVRFNVHELSSGTIVLNICASDVEDRIFFPHSETALFMTEQQIQELLQHLERYVTNKKIQEIEAANELL